MTATGTGTGNGGSEDVKDLYGSPEGRLWELVAGEMLHCGGIDQTITMAGLAGIKSGQKILDLCSGFGSSLRLLVKRFNIQGYGLDLSPYMVEQAKARTRAAGLLDKIEYRQGSVYKIPWRDNSFDVVWGEDAWCYLDTKERFIKEAVRVLKPGGVIAFADWMTGPAGLEGRDAERIHRFMSFPYTESVKGYEKLLTKHGMRITSAENLCDEYVNSMELYLRMITEQLTFDALQILGDSAELFDHVCEEWEFMIEMAQAGKFCQGRIVATKD